MAELHVASEFLIVIDIILMTYLDLADPDRMSRMCWPMRVMATESREQKGMKTEDT